MRVWRFGGGWCEGVCVWREWVCVRGWCGGGCVCVWGGEEGNENNEV